MNFILIVRKIYIINKRDKAYHMSNTRYIFIEKKSININIIIPTGIVYNNKINVKVMCEDFTSKSN